MTYQRLFKFEDPGHSQFYNVLREDLLDCALHLFRRNSRTLKSRALIIPPCEEPGSLGDHAMMSVAVRELRNAGCKWIDLASTADWPLDPAVDGSLDFQPSAGFRHRLYTLRRLADYDYVCLIGADVIDGAYGQDVLDRLALLDLAARLGCRTSVLGASFSDAASELAAMALRSLSSNVTINARDPISRSRMEHSLGRSVALCGDLAALLTADNHHPDTLEAVKWIDSQRIEGRRIVGLNFNGMTADSAPELAKAIEVVARLLCREQCALVLVPHDQRECVSDVRTLRALQQRLSVGNEPSFLVPTTSVAATKAVISRLDLLVTGRMHASILAMSSGIAAVAFPYNGKFEGLYAMMGLADEGLLIELANLERDPQKTATSIVAVLNKKQELQAKLAASLPDYRAAALRNFSGLPAWTNTHRQA